MIAARAMSLAGPAASPFLAYLRLEIRRMLRNPRYLVFTVVLPVTLYVLYTAVMPAVDAGKTVDGLTWPVYFLVSMASYGAMGAAMSQAAPIAIERRQGWARQLRVTPLPGPAYVAAKIVSAVVVTVPALFLVTLVGGLVNHIQLDGRMLLMVAVLAVGCVPLAALGVLIGYLLDADSAQGGMVLTYFALAILGGLFVGLDAFPDWLATIGHVLPSFHLASLGRSVAAGRTPDLVDVVALAGWAIALGGLAAWRYVADERSGRG